VCVLLQFVVCVRVVTICGVCACCYNLWCVCVLLQFVVCVRVVTICGACARCDNLWCVCVFYVSMHYSSNASRVLPMHARQEQAAYTSASHSSLPQQRAAAALEGGRGGREESDGRDFRLIFPVGPMGNEGMRGWV